MGLLQEFFAVVLNGTVFEVRAFSSVGPYIERLTGPYGADREAVMVLKGMPHIGITREAGLVLFEANGETSDAERLENRWGDTTASLAALFLEEEGARTCARRAPLNSWDARWRDESKHVLVRIGDAHPVFRRSCSVLFVAHS